jgi:hypothetical protein
MTNPIFNKGCVFMLKVCYIPNIFFNIGYFSKICTKETVLEFLNTQTFGSMLL